ncbi:sulfotransferase family cytosolic 2B member 1 [Microcaecilia unicolor]|uniref:Sulfotransferase n=1 Tax=Microcaecilia unicolor TaxID=1415580 RepID=A0A6P7XMA9_9AMPH|nr:sulfotransferase family cytosolic 2B member 1-like [Microcaecilia unicolor]
MEYGCYKKMYFSPLITSVELLTSLENEFQITDYDLINVTYPKSGTSWMIEILTLILSGGDTHLSRTVPNWKRMPWVETFEGYWKVQKNECDNPRTFSSHLPIHLFPKSFFKSKAKVIYTVRHPKDVLVSFYYFSRMAIYFKDPESFEQFLQDFFKGELLYGSWFDHVLGWTAMKDQVDLFIMTYEELIKDLRGSVVRICDFLGRKLDEAAINSVVENTTFKSMKDNSMANYSLSLKGTLDQKKSPFMRKGISGDWKNHFTVEQSERFDLVFKEKMKDLCVKFSWEDLKL